MMRICLLTCLLWIGSEGASLRSDGQVESRGELGPLIGVGYMRTSGAPVNYGALQYAGYAATPTAAPIPRKDPYAQPPVPVVNQTLDQHNLWANHAPIQYGALQRKPPAPTDVALAQPGGQLVKYRPAGFNYQPPYGAVQSEEAEEDVDRTFSALVAEFWPVAFSYAKWAVVRTVIFRPLTRFIFGPIFRFLSRALFPLGVDRFILTKWIPFPFISLFQAFLYRKFEHMVFKMVSHGFSYLWNNVLRR